MHAPDRTQKTRGSWSNSAARVKRFLLATIVAVIAIGAPVALAMHVFTDVPDTSPFHDDIAAVREAGITAGKTCEPPGTPPTYCPQEPITREAMAAFVHRGLARVGYAESAQLALSPNGFVELAAVTLTTGGTPGGKGFVVVHGAATAYTNAATGCPCVAGFWLKRVGDTGPLWTQNVTLSKRASGGNLDGFGLKTAGLEWVFPVDTATTYTFSLRGRIFGGTGAVGAYGTLSAVYVPFGSPPEET